MAELCRLLGVSPNGKTYTSIRRHVAQRDIDASHIPGIVPRQIPRRPWSDEVLRIAVAESTTHAEVQRRLGYTPSRGIHRYVKGHILRLGLDTSHFVGQAWNRGQRKPIDRTRRELSTILVRGSTYKSTGMLRRRLVKAGLKPAHCEACGLDTWRGAPLPLELDHINGENTDNRLENLRILCPNCHSVTETWCNKKTSRRTPTGSRGRT